MDNLILPAIVGFIVGAGVVFFMNKKKKNDT